jgi:energy-coupling factor transporter ATP-binding protein EcfA2
VVLSIDNLKFEYSDGLFSLNIENLYFHREEITALVGPAGSGKSTLAFLLAGLREPEKGQISFAGSPLASYPMRELRRAIGLTWQMPDFVMIGPTVKDDIEFGLENLGIDSIDIESVLAQVDLAGFENRIVDTLSGGEKRKLSLAGILATRPEYLILDEPAAFLDTLSILELIEVIRKTAVDGRGILIIGHDLEFISELAQRVIGIKDGRILFDVPATEFFSDGSFLVKLGLPPSPMVRFRQKLLEQGLAIPFASLNPEKIVEYLKSMGIM